MTSGPMGPATDLLEEVHFQLLMLNEQVRNLVELEAPAPQVTVEPAPVILPANAPALDLRPLLESLAALDRQGDREELQALRKEFTDLATAIRHIAGSQSVGSGSSFVTAQTRNEPGETLHVTVDALPASGAATDVSDRAARLLGHVTVDTMPTVTVNNLPATQPVSATSWPLPTGAAQDATLTGGSMKTKLVDSAGVNAAAVSAAGAVKVDGSAVTQPVSGTFFQATQPVSIAAMPSTPVTGTFFQATQPVSLATNTPDVTDRSARLLGHVTVDSAPTTAVTGTFFQATQPVSLAANQSVNNAQVNGNAVVTSVTGVQDVMERKRNGATGLSPNYSASRITTKTTTTVTAATAYISSILVVVSAAGTSATLVIQNKEATPKILVPSFTITVPTNGNPNVTLNFTEPILATSGIDIVTAGTTMGTADVYVTYWQ